MITQLTQILKNIPGWHTNRKLVVFDSDDWGSIGLPSVEVFEKLKSSEFNFENNPYLIFDALESENDLISLFDTLKRFKDKNGRHPVFTANTVMVNPDFEKIKASGFSEYHYEIFTETFKSYPQHKKSFDLWQQGLMEGIFYPQFHAREHLNVAYWIKALQEGHPQIHLGFKNKLYILDNATHSNILHSCTSAHYPKTLEENFEIERAIEDGLQNL